MFGDTPFATATFADIFSSVIPFTNRPVKMRTRVSLSEPNNGKIITSIPSNKGRSKLLGTDDAHTGTSVD